MVRHLGSHLLTFLHFPEDYSSEDLAGKDVVFTVTINSAARQVVPEYDLDFVKNTTEYESLKAYATDTILSNEEDGVARWLLSHVSE